MRALWILLISLGLTACAGQSLRDYQDQHPQFDIETFFDGQLMAYGAVFDNRGRVTRRFTAEIDAFRDQDNNIILDEIFYWSDGSQETRVWQLTPKEGSNCFIAEANDTKGSTTGCTTGNALNMKYQLWLPWRDGRISVTMDDWMYLIDDQRLLNRTRISKFGFGLGEVVLWIERVGD